MASTPQNQLSEVIRSPLIDDQPKASNSGTATNPPTPIFETFTSDKVLREGLCMLRHVGGGQYELLNLSETGSSGVASSSQQQHQQCVPKRRALFERTKHHLEGLAQQNFSLAFETSAMDSFPFQDLPFELRSKILKLVIVGTRGLRLCKTPPSPRLSLRSRHVSTLLVCRQFYEEGKDMVWQNDVRLNDYYLIPTFEFPAHNLVVMENLKRVSFHWRLPSTRWLWPSAPDQTGSWWGRDPRSRRFHAEKEQFDPLHTLPKMKHLEVICDDVVNLARQVYAGKKLNKLYQDDEDVIWFSQAPGFDGLVKLRGLEKITVSIRRRPVSESEMKLVKDLETFLNKVLTLPKPGQVSTHVGFR